MADRFARKTHPYLSQYELAQVLAHRARHLDRGGRPAVDPAGETDPLRIAELELLAGRLQLWLRRSAPGGATEDWRVADLINLHGRPLLPRPPVCPEEDRTPRSQRDMFSGAQMPAS